MMNNVTILALIQILSSLTTGLFILWLTYRGLKLFGKKKFNLKPNNLSYAIFIASFLFAVGYSVSSVIQPLVSSFRLLSETTEGGFQLAWQFFVYGGIYIGIAYTLSILISIIGVYIYTALTPMDEFKEIQNNNIGVAIIVGTIVITLNMISKSGIGLLIESIIPYPNLPPK